MSKKAKRTPLGWSETSSGTYHLRVEVAGKATRRVVACGARVEKDSTILTNDEMVAAVKGNPSHVCSTCLHSPLLKAPSVKWGKGGFIGEDSRNGYTYLRYDTVGINAAVTLRQLKKLHEKLGEYLALVEPVTTATVTITSHPQHKGEMRDNIIPAIKYIRDYTGMSLKDAVDLLKSKSPPLVVFTGDIKKAKALAVDLNRHGVGVEVS